MALRRPTGIGRPVLAEWVVLAILGAACGGTPNSVPVRAPPSITVEPSPTTVGECEDAEFRIAVGGAPPLAYQWWRDGSPIAGADGPIYLLVGATPADNGAMFHAVVSNAEGSISSTRVRLSVGDRQPSSIQFEVIAEESANQIAVSATDIAWTTNGGLRAAPRLCGKPVRTLYMRASDLEMPEGLVIVPERIIWTDVGLHRVLSVSAYGGDPRLLAEPTDDGLWEIALAGDGRLFWPAGRYGLQSMALAGGPVVTHVLGSPGSTRTTGVAVDDRYVYWGDLIQHTVTRMSLEGGDVTVIATNQGFMGGLSANAGYVYWASTDEATTPPVGRILRVSREGGIPTVLATQAAYPMNLVVDESFVYWTSAPLGTEPYSGGGKVCRVAIDGSTPATVLAAGINPYGLAVDAEYVYWVEPAGRVVETGRVTRLKKN